MKKTVMGISVVILGLNTGFAGVLAQWTIVSGGFIDNPVWYSRNVSSGISSIGTIIKLDESKTKSTYYPHPTTFCYQTQNDTRLNPEKYIQIFITPETGYSIDVTRLSFTVWSTTNGAQNIAIRSSLDNFESDLLSQPLNRGANTQINVGFSDKAFSKITEPVEFRIYFWDARGLQVAYMSNNNRGVAVVVDGTVAKKQSVLLSK